MEKKVVAHYYATVGGVAAAALSMLSFIPQNIKEIARSPSFFERLASIYMFVILVINGVGVGILVWFGLIHIFAWWLMSEEEYEAFNRRFFDRD